MHFDLELLALVEWVVHDDLDDQKRESNLLVFLIANQLRHLSMNVLELLDAELTGFFASFAQVGRNLVSIGDGQSNIHGKETKERGHKVFF